MSKFPTTNEPCPTCGTPAECSHRGGTHVWYCDVCGVLIASVLYECEDCHGLDLQSAL